MATQPDTPRAHASANSGGGGSRSGSAAGVRIVQRGTFARGIKKYLLESAIAGSPVHLLADSPAHSSETQPGGAAQRFECTVRNGLVSFSTQVGCPVGCPFCATGLQGWRCDLTAAEITAQVEAVLRDGNVAPAVFEASAQGEPLLNLAATLEALDRLRASYPEVATCIGTCGVVPGIDELVEKICRMEQTGPQLKVTVHSAFQQVRDVLMPGTARWTLDDLAASLRRFAQAFASGPALTDVGAIKLLWGLLPGANDTPADAVRAAELFGGLGCVVHVYTLDVDSGQPWVERARRAAQEARGDLPMAGGLDVRAFADELTRCGLPAVAVPPDPRQPLSVKYYRG